MNLDKYEDALVDANKAINANPSIAKSYYFRGTIYKYLKKYSEAMEDYSKALELDSSDGEIYIRRGILYLAMGNYKQAVDDMEYGLKLKPELKDDKSVSDFLKEAKEKLK